MQINKRGRPKKQQQQQQNVIAINQSISLRNNKQNDHLDITPEYDKIMAQIKETYASLNNASLQKQQQIQDSPKRLKKIVKRSQKLKHPIKSNKKQECLEQNVKLEHQNLQEHLDQIISKFQQIFKNFTENIKIEIAKTEQEMLKILK
ncbi:unnamed protein product [Paramecium pentaurelia]|uniref:Uncharacterized protein n=1 Tax=Paramecium pentaurelia TaxID=43138 RepID=A0A8S1SF31_9CILI|nr:unnamed protein product [Paramecium pentaurelia]